MTKKQFLALNRGDVIWLVHGYPEDDTMPHVGRVLVESKPERIVVNDTPRRGCYYSVMLSGSVPSYDKGPSEWTDKFVMQHAHVTKTAAYLAAAKMKMRHVSRFKRLAKKFERWAAATIKKYGRKAK